MKSVYLDTVGLIALWDGSDQWHERAVGALDAVDKSGAYVLSTTFVLLECGNAAARRPYRSLVEEMRVELESKGKLIAPTRRDWEEAWVAYLRGDAGNAGITDHVSFVVMRRMGMTDALTNDRHFKAAGFNTLF